MEIKYVHSFRSIVWMAILILPFILPALVLGQEAHPRLWSTPERLTEILRLIQVPGSHHALAFQSLKARVEKRDHRVYNGEVENYARTFLAREAGFLHLLTGDTAWSNLSYAMLRSTYYNKTKDDLVRLPDSGYGLGRATTGMGFAMAYDFCYNAWTKEQRSWVKGIIVKSLNEWTELEIPEKEGNHVWAPYISNWVGVCRGAEIIMMLAVHEERGTATGIYHGDPGLTRKARLQFLKGLLITHMENAYGPTGITVEGLSYCSFAGSFLLPAVLALNNTGDKGLDAKVRRHAWWKWVMYAGSFTPQVWNLQNGVSGFNGHRNGWLSLIFVTVPEEELPYYKYFYDRHIGLLASIPHGDKFEPLRGGAIFSLLYYPEKIQEISPEGKFPSMLADEAKGGFYFRRSWQDKDDVLISFMADAGWQEGAWDQAEAFQIGVIGKGARFTTGPGSKYDPGLYSTLLVDQKAYVPSSGTASTSGNKPSDTGAVAYHLSTPQGGYVIADGALKYKRLGMSFAQRHVLADFSHEESVISTLDDLKATQSRAYAWQLNAASENEGGSRITKGTENGRPTFTFSGKDGAYMKGWVLHPVDASIVTTNPFQIKTQGKDAKIWVVLVIGNRALPVPEISGNSMASVLKSGDIRVSYNAAANRIVSDPGTYVAIFPRGISRRAVYGNLMLQVFPMGETIGVTYRLPGHQGGVLSVLSISGKRIMETALPPGSGQWSWTPRDAGGPILPAGRYVLRVRAGSLQDAEPVVLH